MRTKRIIVFYVYDSGERRLRHYTVAFHGTLTEANVNRQVTAWIESVKPGGANQNLSKFLGFLAIPYRAHVVTRGCGVADYIWSAPTFMVI